MHKFLRFLTVFVLFEYHAFLLRYLAGIKNKTFQVKIGKCLSITLQKILETREK